MILNTLEEEQYENEDVLILIKLQILIIGNFNLIFAKSKIRNFSLYLKEIINKYKQSK